MSINQTVLNKSRKDKFILVLTLPQILKDNNVKILGPRTEEFVQLDALQYSIYGSPVPEMSIPPQELSVYGQPYKVTSQTRASYTPIAVNFTVDNRFNNYWILWKWLEILNAPRDSGMPSHFANYQEGADTAQPSPTPKTARDRMGEIASALEGKTGKIKNINTQQVRMINNFLDYQTLITIYGLDEYNQKVVQFNYYNSFITELGGINYNYRDQEEAECSFQFAFNQMDVQLIDPPQPLEPK